MDANAEGAVEPCFNLHNTLFVATQAFLNLVDAMERVDARITALEAKFETPDIVARRISELEKKVNYIDDGFTRSAKECVDQALDSYDWQANNDFEEAVEDLARGVVKDAVKEVVDDIDITKAVRNAVRNLSFTVEVS
jgi:hypothetical protein